MNDHLQTINDKKLLNTPTKTFKKTTDYQFNRFKIDHDDRHRDEYLKE